MLSKRSIAGKKKIVNYPIQLQLRCMQRQSLFVLIFVKLGIEFGLFGEEESGGLLNTANYIGHNTALGRKLSLLVHYSLL